MKKYAINILVILFLLTPFTLFANGCHANNDTIKVLAIGNSFSQDAVEQYLHELGEAEGITMIIGNMFIGGCSLERHVQNIRNNAPAYAYRKVEKDGEKTETRDSKGVRLLTKMSDRTLLRRRNDGTLPFYRDKGKIYYRRSDVLRAVLLEKSENSKK